MVCSKAPTETDLISSVSFPPHVRVIAGQQVLGCTLQTCKPCSCHTSRLKKDPRDTDRTSLVYWIGYLTSAAKWSWSNTSQCLADSRQTTAAMSSPLGDEGYHLQREIDIRLVQQLPGNQQLGQIPQSPQISDHHKG